MKIFSKKGRKKERITFGAIKCPVPFKELREQIRRIGDRIRQEERLLDNC